MNTFDASTYGESFADVYDEWYSDVSDARAMTMFVQRFGDRQHILELGVGTGRLARALTGAGHVVAGVDASPAMLARLDAPDADVVEADMRRLPFASQSFDTVLVATNTLFNLPTASAQQTCLAESRRTLRLGGRLVVEADVPAEPDPALDRVITTKSITPTEVVLTATIRDVDAQQVTGQHIQITEAGIRLRPWRIRYTHPFELDAMAAGTDLRLGDRWAGWNAQPFGADSTHHVSVYVAI